VGVCVCGCVGLFSPPIVPENRNNLLREVCEESCAGRVGRRRSSLHSDAASESFPSDAQTLPEAPRADRRERRFREEAHLDEGREE